MSFGIIIEAKKMYGASTSTSMCLIVDHRNVGAGVGVGHHSSAANQASKATQRNYITF